MIKWSYRALRLSVQRDVESLLGKWVSRKTIEKRRGTLSGVGEK
jgi:hypothetical protein